MKKSKFLALLLTLAMLLTLIPAVSAADYDASGATTFVFTDKGITVKDGKYTGYDTDGTSLTINGSGTYIVSGSCSDGSISVKKETTGVTLVLDGLDLTSSATAPITCGKSSEVTIVVSGKNSLTDSEQNNADNYPDNADAESAVIKCKDGSKVVICGSGSLDVTSNGKNGIKSGATTEAEGEASLTIRELTLNITTTVNDALNAEALLNVESGNITISAADDGLHSDYTLNIGKTGAAGPTINILKSSEGIEGADIGIFSGDITIHSSDDCINAGNSDLSGYRFALSISGGNLVMDTTAGDGIDSNGTIDISGGN
ncbi:MAG: carbohydrate-binding domain-containing protein, partial [Candidatus Flemingiibacterium sp.]